MLVRAVGCASIVALAAFATGCSAGPEIAAEDVSGSEDAVSGGSACELLDESADNVMKVTLVLGSASVACEAAVLVTTAGTASPACLVPAAGFTAGAIVSLLTRGAHTLLCSRGREMSVELDSDRTGTDEGEAVETCEGGVERTCSKSVHRDLAERKANACNVPRSCDSTMSCEELQTNITRNSECVTARDRVTDVCCGGQSGPRHDSERDAVLRTLEKCTSLLARCEGAAPAEE